MSSLLALFIRVLHLSLVAFVLLAHTSNSIGILVLHVSTCFCLLVHWIAMNNTCSLTLLESSLRGVENCETFMHSIVAPVYDIPEGILSTICKVVTTIVMLISMYKLYNSQEFVTALKKLIVFEEPLKQMNVIFGV